MTQIVSPPMGTSPTLNTPLGRIRDVLPKIAAQAAQTEDARRISPELVDDLRAAGCFRMLLPKSHYGEEISLLDALAIAREIARADGATGWTASLLATTPLLLAFLPAASFDEIYADGPDVIAAGALAPKGKATPEDGDWRVSGQWPFASGCQEASYIYLQCIEQKDGRPVFGSDGIPVMRLVVFDAADVEILDTWEVSGLRGTGSHDVRVDNLLCPGDRSALLLGGTPSQRSPLLHAPVLDQLGLFIAAIATGIAEGAVGEVADLARSGKRPAFSPRGLGQSPLFQYSLGEAHMKSSAAAALLLSEAETTWSQALADAPFTLHDRARMRATAAQATALAVEAVDTAYTIGGGSAIYETSPLQRRLRDVHAATQHVAARRDSFAILGAVLAGADVGDIRI